MSNQRPNILWLCSDQQRYDTIGALGNPYIDTPNLDKLCENGVAFTNTYCQNPVCTPSRASFLTGRYPSSIITNRMGSENYPEYCKLITKALADAGYYCGNIGKLHIFTAWGGWEDRCDDGYAEFHFNHASGHHLDREDNAYAQWLKAKGVDYHDLFTTDGRDYCWYKPDAPVELRQTAWCAETAIDFIRRNQDKPWMLTVNCFDPHPPYDAPQYLEDKYLARNLPDAIFNESDYELADKLKNVLHRSGGLFTPDQTRADKANYYGMCEIVDMHFGRIIDALDEMGLRENTIIIFNADHGEMLGDHGLQLKGCRFYDGAVRVPLIFSWPGHFHNNKQVSDLTELTDIVPTLTEICGIDFPETHGRSLLPTLCDCGREQEKREFARCEYYDANPPKPGGESSYGTMYRDDRYKLVVYHNADWGELYDMENDPREEHNLWANPEYAELCFKLMKKSFDTSAIYGCPNQHRRGRY